MDVGPRHTWGMLVVSCKMLTSFLQVQFVINVAFKDRGDGLRTSGTYGTLLKNLIMSVSSELVNSEINHDVFNVILTKFTIKNDNYRTKLSFKHRYITQNNQFDLK